MLISNPAGNLISLSGSSAAGAELAEMKMAHKISSKRRNSNPLKRGFDFIFLNDLQSICLNPQQIQYHADTSQGGRERMYYRENKIQRVLSKKRSQPDLSRPFFGYLNEKLPAIAPATSTTTTIAACDWFCLIDG